MISYVPVPPRRPVKLISNARRRQNGEARKHSYMEASLKTILDGLAVIASSGSLDRTITFLATDSRRVGPGCLFFALPGESTDGSFFIEEAIDRGATAVVTEQARRPHPGVALIRVPDARLAMAQAARRFYGCPDESLMLCGITGARGKSTVAHLLKHLLDTGGRRAGLIGSITYDLGSRTVPSFRTTPDAVELSGLLGQMRGAGVKEAAIEINGAGLRQKSVFELQWRVGVFLNSPVAGDPEELPDQDESARVRGFFSGETGTPPETAVICADDPLGCELIAALPDSVRKVSFGTGADAEFRSVRVVPDSDSTRITLAWPGGETEILLPMVGEPNAANFVAAAAAAYAMGRDPATFGRAMAEFPGVPGRMERIDGGQAFYVFVDHGHTANRLSATLDVLRKVIQGRILVVFGCGGNRDRAARAEVVERIQDRADFVWATADNTRGESLERIFADMEKGVTDSGRIAFVADRREAIRRAFEQAADGDCVLLAGKGNESFLEMGDTLLPFDDRMVARELLALLKT